jgi:hypothetical protein
MMIFVVAAAPNPFLPQHLPYVFDTFEWCAECRISLDAT